mmetsp:Transcript_18443/g.43796  ORF Transcript_18443/g.43796 Transcript_18443/m.43796 type:complete len:383 (-) Transcript_18443:1998-3146(-)
MVLDRHPTIGLLDRVCRDCRTPPPEPEHLVVVDGRGGQLALRLPQLGSQHCWLHPLVPNKAVRRVERALHVRHRLREIAHLLVGPRAVYERRRTVRVPIQRRARVFDCFTKRPPPPAHRVRLPVGAQEVRRGGVDSRVEQRFLFVFDELLPDARVPPLVQLEGLVPLDETPLRQEQCFLGLLALLLGLGEEHFALHRLLPLLLEGGCAVGEHERHQTVVARVHLHSFAVGVACLGVVAHHDRVSALIDLGRDRLHFPPVGRHSVVVRVEAQKLLVLTQRLRDTRETGESARGHVVQLRLVHVGEAVFQAERLEHGQHFLEAFARLENLAVEEAQRERVGGLVDNRLDARERPLSLVGRNELMHALHLVVELAGLGCFREGLA